MWFDVVLLRGKIKSLELDGGLRADDVVVCAFQVDDSSGSLEQLTAWSSLLKPGAC